VSKTLNLLRREHTHLAKLLKLLDRQIARFGAGERPDYDIISGIIEYCLDFPDQCHHPKEDLIYRKLQERDPEAAEAVGDLENEHEKLSGLTLELAATVRRVLGEVELPRDYVMKLAEEFLTTYRLHIQMEEQLFFPAAERVLTQDDWAGIDARVNDHSDPLFGEHVHERFQSLRDDIYAMDRIA
jgi:hemerythrin-like domain-containing protein